MSARRDDLIRRWRATSGRGRKLRGLVALLAPYRGRVVADVHLAACWPRARRWRRRRWPRWRSTRASSPATDQALTLDRRRLPGHRAPLLGRDVRADLPRRLDRPAGAAGPADPALRAPADDVGRLLLAQARGRADLAALQRRRGARHARLRRHRDPVRLVADADRHRGDPVHARRPARAAHLHRLPDPRDRVVRLPDRQRRRLPGHAREGRLDHRATCRRRSRASASCARSRRSRATWRASPSSTRRTAART